MINFSCFNNREGFLMIMKFYNRNYIDYYRFKVVVKKDDIKIFIMVKFYFNSDYVWFYDDFL